MRISSNSLFVTSSYNMQNAQYRIAQLNEQLSSLKRVNRPSDDPVASAQLINLGQSISRNDQMIKNAQTVESQLATTEEYLRSASGIIQNINDLAIQAGNSSLSNEDRQMLRTSLQEQVKDLVGLANSTDGQGRYIFGGTRTQTPPFALTIDNAGIQVKYNGDWGRQEVAASSSRDIAITEPGGLVFGAGSGGGAGSELWTSLSNLDKLLADGPDVNPNYSADLSAAMGDLKTGHEQLLRSQASIGARRAEAQTLLDAGQGLSVQYKSNVGQLQDLDYIQAVTDLQMAITAMDTSQKTYKLVSDLSLFKYI